MKKLQKRIASGTLDVKDNDPFELFVAATNVRYCYYNETHSILGSTYRMLVLQVSYMIIRASHKYQQNKKYRNLSGVALKMINV